MKINEGFLNAMRDAMTLLRTQGPARATDAIQRALQGEIADATDKGFPRERESSATLSTRAGAMERRPRADEPQSTYIDVEDLGHVSTHTYTNTVGRRQYRLYVPPRVKSESLPLIVMLHGCTQDADDFAVGTQMNTYAAQHRCFVAYPIQPAQANPSKCWNWFKPEDQCRESGEPSLIAGITREIMATHNIDSTRVYVAGLSAGGAMAAIMLDTYPELYAAAGVHSGLPAHCAHDLPSALAAMKGGKGRWAKREDADAVAPRRPVIVFHGDADATVHIANAKKIVQGFNVRSGMQTDARPDDGGHRSCTVSRLVSDRGVDAELWTIHGAPHAWSGGNTQGSYTDPKGPNASAEMLRFFFDHPMHL